MSRRIVIVDTSVFLNILDVPGRNQHRDQTLNAVESHVWNGDHLYLPVPCIIETGNHIARLPNGRHRYRCANALVEQATAALEGQAPWKAVPFSEKDESSDSALRRWLLDFPSSAQVAMSLTDLTVKDLYESYCRKFSMSDVGV